MKLTKERVIILILAVLLLATAVAAVWFCLYTKSAFLAGKRDFETMKTDLAAKTECETVYRDGLWVEDLVYLTDFEVDAENGQLRFTLTNKSSRLCGDDEFYLIQRKEGGEWVFVPSSLAEKEKPETEPSAPLGAFGQTAGRCAFPVEEQTPGEYRVLLAQGAKQGKNETYLIGYFNIPASGE